MFDFAGAHTHLVMTAPSLPLASCADVVGYSLAFAREYGWPVIAERMWRLHARR